MFHDDPQKDGDELTDEAVKDLDSPAEDSEGVSGGKCHPRGSRRLSSRRRSQ